MGLFKDDDGSAYLLTEDVSVLDFDLVSLVECCTESDLTTINSAPTG
jgi:hypothetical protein